MQFSPPAVRSPDVLTVLDYTDISTSGGKVTLPSTRRRPAELFPAYGRKKENEDRRAFTGGNAD